MKTIRHSAFETNSSSTHSICVNWDTKVFESITPDKDGNIVLEGGEFRWEIENYSDPLTKANYCALDVDGNDEWMFMLREVITEHTGAKDVILKLAGYIDHQSLGTSHEAFESKEKLKAFIFGDGSVLETDNDNH